MKAKSQSNSFCGLFSKNSALASLLSDSSLGFASLVDNKIVRQKMTFIKFTKWVLIAKIDLGNENFD